MAGLKELASTFTTPDDELRATVTLVMLELNAIVHKYFGAMTDPKSACMVSAAVAHGCSIGTPFGVSKISDLTGLSRRKVYDVLEGLGGVGLLRRAEVEGITHPVYVRDMDSGAQQTIVPCIYQEIADAVSQLCDK